MGNTPPSVRVKTTIASWEYLLGHTPQNPSVSTRFIKGADYERHPPASECKRTIALKEFLGHTPQRPSVTEKTKGVGIQN